MRRRKAKTHNPAEDLLALIQKTDINDQREKLALLQAMYVYAEKWFVEIPTRESISFIASHFVVLLGPKEIPETILEKLDGLLRDSFVERELEKLAPQRLMTQLTVSDTKKTVQVDRRVSAFTQLFSGLSYVREMTGVIQQVKKNPKLQKEELHIRIGDMVGYFRLLGQLYGMDTKTLGSYREQVVSFQIKQCEKIIDQTFNYIRNSITEDFFDADLYDALVLLIAEVKDLNVLMLLISNMRDLVARIGLPSDWGQELAVELSILSYKALEQFDPYRHPYSNIEDIVAGFLQAADFEGLKKAVPLLAVAVERLPAESPELEEAKLYLARCQVLLAETDKAFVQGLEEHFNLFPSIDRVFTSAIVGRAHNAYFNPALSKDERLLAHQVLSAYVMNDGGKRRIDSGLQPKGFPDDLFVTPAEALEVTKSVALEDFDDRDTWNDKRLSESARASKNQKLQKARTQTLPALRRVDFVNRYYRNMFYDAKSFKTKDSDRTNPENMRHYFIPVVYSAIKLGSALETGKGSEPGAEYAEQISQFEFAHNPGGKAGQTIYRVSDTISFALKVAGGLRALHFFLDKWEKKELLSAEEVQEVRRLISENDRGMDIKDNRQLLVELVNSDAISAVLDTDSPLPSMLSASREEIESMVIDNASYIIHDLVQLCLKVLEPGLFVSTDYWHARPDDAAKHRAYTFLLRPEIFKTLSDEQSDKVFMSLASLVDQVYSDFEGEGLFSKAELLNPSLSALLEKELHFGERRSASKLLEELDEAVARLDFVIDAGERAQARHEEQEKPSFWFRDRKDKVNALKDFRANLVQKQAVLKGYATFREEYLQPLIDFIKEAIKVLGKADPKLTEELQGAVGLLESKEAMFRYHVNSIVALHQGKISPHTFITEVMSESHSTSIADRLGRARSSIEESTSGGFSLFARKPKASLQNTSEFVLANYSPLSREEEKRKAQEAKERDPLSYVDWSTVELPTFPSSSKEPVREPITIGEEEFLPVFHSTEKDRGQTSVFPSPSPARTSKPTYETVSPNCLMGLSLFGEEKSLEDKKRASGVVGPDALKEFNLDF